MYALHPLPATLILKTDTKVTHSFVYSTTYELPHGTGHGATVGDAEVGETGMAPTLTEIMANREAGKINQPTNKYKIAICEKCSEGKEDVRETVRNVISMASILGQVL